MLRSLMRLLILMGGALASCQQVQSWLSPSKEAPAAVTPSSAATTPSSTPESMAATLPALDATFYEPPKMLALAEPERYAALEGYCGVLLPKLKETSRGPDEEGEKYVFCYSEPWEPTAFERENEDENDLAARTREKRAKMQLTEKLPAPYTEARYLIAGYSRDQEGRCAKTDYYLALKNASSWFISPVGSIENTSCSAMISSEARALRLETPTGGPSVVVASVALTEPQAPDFAWPVSMTRSLLCVLHENGVPTCSQPLFTEAKPEEGGDALSQGLPRWSLQMKIAANEVEFSGDPKMLPNEAQALLGRWQLGANPKRLRGPFRSIAERCQKDEYADKDCGKVRATLATPAAPYRAVSTTRLADELLGLVLETEAGVFVAEIPTAASIDGFHPGTIQGFGGELTEESLTLEDVFPGGAPELLYRYTFTITSEDYAGEDEDEDESEDEGEDAGTLSSEKLRLEELVVCELSASGFFRCYAPQTLKADYTSKEHKASFTRKHRFTPEKGLHLMPIEEAPPALPEFITSGDLSTMFTHLAADAAQEVTLRF